MGRRAEKDRVQDAKKFAAQLRQYEKFCKQKGGMPADVALAWLLANPVVTAPIIGPRTVDQLDKTVSAVDLKLSEEFLKELDSIWPGPGGEAPEAYAW